MKHIRIGVFGLRNSGKSSLVNCITNQEVSVVSEVKGTTTDPVKKSMELLPIGPVTIIDTPGYDDEGSLGKKRIETTKKILRNCDVAILVSVAGENLQEKEEELISVFEERKVPYLIVKNKIDLLHDSLSGTENIIYVSSLQKRGIEELKERIGKLVTVTIPEKEIHFVRDFIKEGDIVVLVTPIDESAPKGRMILPQQMAIRDILDGKGIVITVQDFQLSKALEMLKQKPALVITDSQVFHKVRKIVPKDIFLTSFSILMARLKGVLNIALDGAKYVDELKDGSKVLISEGCSHHKQCEDIGTVKLPKWLKEYTKKDIEFEWTNGNDFPEDLTKYDLIIHCGGCMLNENEMKYRMELSKKQNIPFTNYGVIISYIHGLLDNKAIERLKY